MKGASQVLIRTLQRISMTLNIAGKKPIIQTQKLAKIVKLHPLRNGRIKINVKGAATKTSLSQGRDATSNLADSSRQWYGFDGDQW